MLSRWSDREDPVVCPSDSERESDDLTHERALDCDDEFGGETLGKAYVLLPLDYFPNKL